MKKLSRILTVCAVLLVVSAFALFSVSADNAVTPTNAAFTTTSVCPHCNKVVETWTPITTISSDTFVSASGHYVVEAGTTLTYSKTSSIGASASDVAILVIGNIDLTGAGQLRFGNTGTTTTWLIGGGGRIQGGNAPDTHFNPSLLGVYANGTVNIIGDITIQGNETETITTNRGGVLNIYSTGKVNMYGGTVNAFNIDTSADKHAGILVRSGGTFNMYGGTVNGGSVKYGAAMEILTSGNIAIHGGTVNGGSASTGGVLYMNGGSFTMDGGTLNGGTTSGSGTVMYITGGEAEISGTSTVTAGTCGGSGGIAYMTGGSLNVSGSAVLTGTTANYGGLVYIDSNASLEISGNPQLSGGNANTYGAAFYNKGSLTISGGTITGGNAKSGGVMGTNGGTTTINGGTISGGNATEKGGTIYMHTSAHTVNIQAGANITGGNAANGGMLYMSAGTLNMTGGTITGGIATNSGVDSSDGHGGCMYLAGGTATLEGGTITGGKTVRKKNSSDKTNGGDGATFYVTSSTLNLDGVTVTGGTCYRGGVFYVTGSSGRVNMTAGTINSGVASSQGDVAAVYNGAVFNMNGGIAHNNETGEGSGIRVQSGKVYLHGNALVEAAAGGRNGFDMISASSTSAVLVLAGNARVGDMDGNQTNVHNITFQSYSPSTGTTYYPILRIANDWTGYATITDNFGSTVSGEYIMSLTSGDTTKYYAQCGTWDAANLTFTKGGTYETGKLVHGGANDGDLPVFGEEGNLMLPRAKAVVNGTNTWYRLADQAADAAADGNGYAVLYKDDANPITIASGKTVCMDFNGFDVAVTGEGTLQGMDTSALTNGEGTSVVTVDGVTLDIVVKSPATGDTYVALKDGNTVGFHAVTANITSVNIRPSSVGMYYSAKFVCDETLQAHLKNFGLAVSVADMPGADFATDSTVLYTQSPASAFGTDEFHSVLVNNIMAEALAAATNKNRAEIAIYANAYMTMTIDGQDYIIMATTTSEFSLKTLLQEVNTYWDTFDETAQTALATQIYDPYVRQFETDDWKIYNMRIKANGGYTAEEETILEARRQTVMDYMRESISLLWRSDKTFTYSLGNTERDQGKSFTIVEGRLYRGMPYVYAAGTTDAFLEYAGEPDKYGIYTITGIEATALNYESYGGRVGNDCSGAVTNAWSQVSSSVAASTSSGCSPYFGVVPVGNYIFNAPINPSTHRVLDTKVVVETNGQQTMFEAYAMLKPADAAYHQEYPSTKGNHIRMVSSVHVVRNSDGTINGASSYIIMLEQTRNLTSNNTTTTHPETGETIYVIGGIDRKFTFNALFNDHYIPVTIAELRDPTPVEETWVTDSLEEEATIENLFTGTISSNRYTDSLRITIYNENGEIVQQSTSRKSRSYSKLFRMTQFANEKPGSFKGLLDLEALPAGNYRCTVTLKLTIDEDYVHTVRDFTFSK